MKRADSNPSIALTHQQAQELIQKSLQARLGDFERASLETHLAACAECGAYAANARGLDQRLAVSLPERWPEPRYSPAELQRRQASVQSRLRRKTLFKNFSSFARLAGAAALLIAVIAGLGWLALRGAPRPQIGGGVPDTATPAARPTQAKTLAVEATTTPAARPTLTQPAAPTVEPFTRYTVQAGDTCSTIAYRSNIALVSLIQMNGLSANCEIAVGQELRIPKPTPTPPIADAGRIDLAEAERLVKEFVFNSQPGMAQDVNFPLQELTTDEIWQGMRAQVFKVSEGVQQFQSYVIINGQVTPIGESFGGLGVHTLLVADLDADTAPELVYAYSFGSGIHQSSIGMLRRMDDGSYAAFAISNFHYFGELRLKKQDDQAVLVTGTANSGGEQKLGRLMLLDTRLVIAPGDAALVEYTSPEHGISFLYPETWQASPDTYFRLSALLDWNDGEGNLSRACEREANLADKIYGAQPVIQMTLLGGREACIIAPQAGASQQNWVIFFASAGKINVLTVDGAYAQVIGQSFRYLEALPTPTPQAVDMTPRAPSLKQPQTRALGSLTLGEYIVVSAGEDTPTHFEYYARILDTIFPDRHSWGSSSMDETIQRTNEQLAPFGYKIVARKDGSNNRIDLYWKENLLREGLSMFYPPSIYHEENGASSFAMVVEDKNYKALLVQNSPIPGQPLIGNYDLMNSRGTRPVIAKNNLISVRRGDSRDGADRVELLANGETVFTYTLAPAAVAESVKTLDEWNGNWVLEVNGTLLVSGESWNEQLRADEIFNWTKINGAPFFFFRRAGKIHAWYDGQELPLGYDEIIHYRCCEPAAFNVVNSPNALWFHARREGVWYYVEIKK